MIKSLATALVSTGLPISLVAAKGLCVSILQRVKYLYECENWLHTKSITEQTLHARIQKWDRGSGLPLPPRPPPPPPLENHAITGRNSIEIEIKIVFRLRDDGGLLKILVGTSCPSVK